MSLDRNMSHKVYDFDQVIDRRYTHSFKWDNVTYPANADMLPMPVADMDFVVADEILAAIDQIICLMLQLSILCHL